MGNLFVPHELKTIEVDVEKKIFRVNGEDFGMGCTGFTIWCDAPDDFNIHMEINTKVHFAKYQGIDRISVSEHPVKLSWYSNGQKTGQEGKAVNYITLCLVKVGYERLWVKAPAYKVSVGDSIVATVNGGPVRGIVEDCTTVADTDELFGMLKTRERILEAKEIYSLTWAEEEGI